MTLTPYAERLAMELSLPVFYDLGLSRLGFEHQTFRLRGQRSNPLCHRRGLEQIIITLAFKMKKRCSLSQRLSKPYGFFNFS